MDFLNSSLWDLSVFFSNDDMMVDEPEPAPIRERQRVTSIEDLVNVFLEWLKSDSDLISLEEIQSIKLKKSTIECVAHRLDSGIKGMM